MQSSLQGRLVMTRNITLAAIEGSHSNVQTTCPPEPLLYQEAIQNHPELHLPALKLLRQGVDQQLPPLLCQLHQYSMV